MVGLTLFICGKGKDFLDGKQHMKTLSIMDIISNPWKKYKKTIETFRRMKIGNGIKREVELDR